MVQTKLNVAQQILFALGVVFPYSSTAAGKSLSSTKRGPGRQHKYTAAEKFVREVQRNRRSGTAVVCSTGVRQYLMWASRHLKGTYSLYVKRGKVLIRNVSSRKNWLVLDRA